MKNSFTFKKPYFIATIVLFLTEVIIALYTKGFIRHTLGDFLVVILIYCFLRTFINAKPLFLAFGTLLFACLIEGIQYLNVLPWFGREDSQLAHIIMGSTFDSNDVVAYALGVIFVLVVEGVLSRRK